MRQRPSLAAASLTLAALALHAKTAPLPASLADHATAYMEWLLDTPFTEAQRGQYQQMLAEMWRGGKNGSPDTILAMARAYERSGTLSDADRAVRQRDFLKLLEEGTDGPSRWLLAVYRDAHAGQDTPAADPAASPALTGKWRTSHISTIQYRNTYTGAPAPTNGQTFAYEFKADGTYSFTGLLQSVMYQCTHATFSSETGTYTVEGDTLSLQPEKNPYRMTNNCAPSSNREAPGKLIPRSYRFRVTIEDGRRYLELRGADGGLQRFPENP